MPRIACYVLPTPPSHRCAAYYADIAAGSTGREVAFNPELGLAMELLGGGDTIAQLWSVM